MADVQVRRSESGRLMLPVARPPRVGMFPRVPPKAFGDMTYEPRSAESAEDLATVSDPVLERAADRLLDPASEDV